MCVYLVKAHLTKYNTPLHFVNAKNLPLFRKERARVRQLPLLNRRGIKGEVRSKQKTQPLC
jgi:hypothetical protein